MPVNPFNEMLETDRVLDELFRRRTAGRGSTRVRDAEPSVRGEILEIAVATVSQRRGAAMLEARKHTSRRNAVPVETASGF